MKVQFELTIGQNKFTLEEDVESNADFFKKLHFYSTLPKVGPNGETDLVLSYRVAQKQYEYYSIVSEKAQMEFRFGMSKEGKGKLFSKGWEPLHRRTSEEAEESDTPREPAAPIKAAVRTAKPTVGRTATVKREESPVPTPAAPEVAAQAANILSKFGI